jgi:GNAT superfamily N-acetyltransferase
MAITIHPAQPADFDYCSRLYFSGMDRIIRDLKLERTAAIADFRERWEAAQVRLIQRDGGDVGWLQSALEDDSLFLAQLFSDAPFQGQGIGSEVMKHLIAEATRAGRAMTLGVVKTNPAQRLYKRLGFRVTHDDDRKFYMRRD